MLRDFENADKHKLLRILLSVISSGNVGFLGPAIAHGTKGVFVARKGEVEDGTEVAAFVFDRPTLGMKYDNTEFMLIFALPHRKAADGISDRDDATTLLRLIEEEVHTVVDSVAANVK